jgi:hemolysin D
MHDRLSALAELFKRYGAVLNAAWRARHELDTEPRLAHELAFLPAHLELVETPVHPAPKWAIRALLAFAGLALLWSIFGKLDIVATAKGKLVPNARVKIVQPLDTGIVRRILVQDGQRVKAGQSLIELDVTQAQADVAKTRAARVDAQLTIARTTAVLAAEKDNTFPKMAPIPDAPVERYAEVQRFANGQFSEYRQKIDEMNAELAKRMAELDTARRQVDKLSQTAPLARERARGKQEIRFGKRFAVRGKAMTNRIRISRDSVESREDDERPQPRVIGRRNMFGHESPTVVCLCCLYFDYLTW